MYQGSRARHRLIHNWHGEAPHGLKHKQENLQVMTVVWKMGGNAGGKVPVLLFVFLEHPQKAKPRGGNNCLY